MLFNYIRFGNIFEFGFTYQLTVNKINEIEYKFARVPFGLISYFFAPPIATIKYPYFVRSIEMMNFYGYCYYAAFAGGLVFLNPIILALLFIKKIKKHISNELFNFILCFIIVGILISIIEIILSSGIVQRYVVDFSWMIVFAAILVVFSIYEMIKNTTFRKYFLKFLIVICIFTIIINFFLCAVQGENNLLQYEYPEQYYKLMYSIQFWE